MQFRTYRKWKLQHFKDTGSPKRITLDEIQSALIHQFLLNLDATKHPVDLIV